MREIDKSKPVLITGGSGYVASWIIKMLLEEGIGVNATAGFLTTWRYSIISIISTITVHLSPFWPLFGHQSRQR